MLRMVLCCGLLLCGLTSAFAAKQYSYFRVGNSSDITTTTTPGIVLMGGGTDVDAAFQWMCGRSGGGDFLVIRATGTDAYNPYIQQLCPGINSVATLIIPIARLLATPSSCPRFRMPKLYGSPAGTNRTTSMIGRDRPFRTNSTP